MGTEADNCRTKITSSLQAAGWKNDPHFIAEQRTFTDGRISLPDAGPFNLLCHLASNAQMFTHRQRAFRSLSASIVERARVRCRSPGCSPISAAIREHLPGILTMPLILERGNVNEIISKFRGADELRTAANQPQPLQ